MTDREWFDEYTQHMVDTELYAEARAVLAEEMLTKLNKELQSVISSYGTIKSKALENECMRECDERIEKYLDEWKNEEEKERQAQAENESSWLSNTLKAALGVAVVASALKIKKALETPFSEADTFGTFSEGLKTKVQKSIRTPLLSARIFGSSGSTVAESLDSAMTRLKRETKANMRTAVTSVQRNVQRQLLTDNRKLRFRYISMLDDSTCMVCGSYSGTVYEDLSEGPDIPVHIRCRCFYQPILSSSEGNGDIESYQEWFDRQPDSVQYKIIGPTRYAFYKSGITNIRTFTSEGRKLTLDELFEKNNMFSVNTGARSQIVNKILASDIIQKNEIVENYYKTLKKSDNIDLIKKITENSEKSYEDIEKVINYVFKEMHPFENGKTAYFDPDADIVLAIERLKTKEFTDTDILWLNHELEELTLMKNKHYTIYEDAHIKANEKYNWQEAIK